MDVQDDRDGHARPPGGSTVPVVPLAAAKPADAWLRSPRSGRISVLRVIGAILFGSFAAMWVATKALNLVNAYVLN